MTNEQDNTKTVLLIFLAAALFFSLFYIASLKQQYFSLATASLFKEKGIII